MKYLKIERLVNKKLCYMSFHLFRWENGVQVTLKNRNSTKKYIMNQEVAGQIKKGRYSYRPF